MRAEQAASRGGQAAGLTGCAPHGGPQARWLSGNSRTGIRTAAGEVDAEQVEAALNTIQTLEQFTDIFLEPFVITSMMENGEITRCLMSVLCNDDVQMRTLTTPARPGWWRGRGSYSGPPRRR